MRPLRPRRLFLFRLGSSWHSLSNFYFFLAINEVLVIRSTTDLTVWRTVLFALLLADFGHLYSVSALGFQIHRNFLSWNAIDWGNVGFMYVGAMMRLAFLLGDGVPCTLAPLYHTEDRQQGERLQIETLNCLGRDDCRTWTYLIVRNWNLDLTHLLQFYADS